MMITVNHITIANKSWCTPYLSANAVASETTTEECTDGIPPLHRDLSKSRLPEPIFTIIPFIITDSTKVTAGTKMRVS